MNISQYSTPCKQTKKGTLWCTLPQNSQKRRFFIENGKKAYALLKHLAPEVLDDKVYNMGIGNGKDKNIYFQLNEENILWVYKEPIELENDLLFNPRIEFEIDRENETAEIKVYRMDSSNLYIDFDNFNDFHSEVISNSLITSKAELHNRFKQPSYNAFLNLVGKYLNLEYNVVQIGAHKFNEDGEKVLTYVEPVNLSYQEFKDSFNTNVIPKQNNGMKL